MVGILAYAPLLAIPGSAENLPAPAQPQDDESRQVESRGFPVPAIPLLPDAKASIDQEWLDNFHLRYKAEIRVVNKGNVPTPPVQVQTLGMRYNPASTPPNPSQCVANRNCTIEDRRTIGPLAPGDAKKYKVDPKFTAAETVLVEVTIFCNPPNNCAELDTANNKVRKVLGPH
jgi:hypothetical protein